MATQKERLQQLTEIRDPALRVARILSDRTVAKAILKLGTLIGSDGYTPVKGKDYFTPTEVQSIVSFVRSQVKDGRDGRNGLNGMVGPRGKDGENGKDGKEGPAGKDGLSPSIQSVLDELRRVPIEYKDVKGAPDLKSIEDLIKFLKMGGFRGGGSSATGTVTVVYTVTPAGLIDGSNVTYTVINTITNVYSFAINGQFLHPTTDYTFSNKTITMASPLDASLSGKPFTITYS